MAIDKLVMINEVVKLFVATGHNFHVHGAPDRLGISCSSKKRKDLVGPEGCDNGSGLPEKNRGAVEAAINKHSDQGGHPDIDEKIRREK